MNRSSTGFKWKVDKLPANFMDTVIGYNDVKSLFRRSILAEPQTHILLAGPPSSAKTVILLECERLNRSAFILGYKTTKAGLVKLLLDRMPSYLLIDEVEKMDKNAYSVLLGLMDPGVVVDVKYQGVETEYFRTNVYAACITGDTLISVPHGSEPAKDIEVGDIIYGYHPSLGLTLSKVYRKIRRKTKSLVSFETNSSLLSCTPEHMIFTDKGWLPSQSLNPSSRIYSLGHKYERTSICVLGRLPRWGRIFSHSPALGKSQEQMVPCSNSQCLQYKQRNVNEYQENVPGIYRSRHRPKERRNEKIFTENSISNHLQEPHRISPQGHSLPNWEAKTSGVNFRISTAPKQNQDACAKEEVLPPKGLGDILVSQVDELRPLSIQKVSQEISSRTQEVFDFTTSTGNYFANTILVHNCNDLSDLLPELLSRFHFKLEFKAYSYEEFIQVGVNVLTMLEETEPFLARYIVRRVAEYSRDVRDTIGIARLARDEEQVDRLIETQIKYRPMRYEKTYKIPMGIFG